MVAPKKQTEGRKKDSTHLDKIAHNRPKPDENENKKMEIVRCAILAVWFAKMAHRTISIFLVTSLGHFATLPL